VHEYIYSFEEAYSLFQLSNGLEPEAKEAKRLEIAAGPLKAWFQRFNAHIALSPSGYVVGDSLTVADLRLRTMVGSFLSGNVDYVPPSYMEQFPHLVQHHSFVGAHPSVAAYYSK
jgi:glutathione S-transferase